MVFGSLLEVHQPIALGIGVATAVIWFYILLGRGGFWNIREAVSVDGVPAAAAVVVVIPARNEAAGIAGTVSSLLGQTHEGSLDIVLVDDHSSDGTADLARAAARALGAEHRLDVIAARALPPGWTGKLWAVSEGLARAREKPAHFFLLTDADIVHAPDNVSTLVRRATRGTPRPDIADGPALDRDDGREGLDPELRVLLLHALSAPHGGGSAVPGRRRGRRLHVGSSEPPSTRIGGIAAIRGALIDDCALAAADQAERRADQT